MPAHQDTLWYIDPNHPVLLIDWHDQPSKEIIAYHTATGDIHLITPDSALILELLQNQTQKLSAEEITERFRAKLNQPDLEFDQEDIINSFLLPFLDLELIDMEENPNHDRPTHQP